MKLPNVRFRNKETLIFILKPFKVQSYWFFFRTENSLISFCFSVQVKIKDVRKAFYAGTIKLTLYKISEQKIMNQFY